MRWPCVLFILKVAAASLLGGVIGAISGLGGGIVIVPVLTLFLRIPVEQAIGASVVSVIAVSSGAGSVYVRDHITNVRIAMFLNFFTVVGAILGAGVLVKFLNDNRLEILFGLTLLLSLLPLLARMAEELPRGVKKDDRLARWLQMRGSYFDQRLQREVPYWAERIPTASGVMTVAGLMAGILGIGAGVLKVLALETGMRLPVKVSTATRNFMIGVTAAAAAGVYLHRGLVLPFVVVPVAASVLLGALLGTKMMERMSNVLVRKIFAVALLVMGVQMLLSGLGMTV